MLWSLLHFLLSKLCSVFMFEQKREDRYLCYFNLRKNLPQVSSVLKLLNVRTFTRDLFDPDFSSMELYLVSQAGLNNHFPLQRLIPFSPFSVLFLFVDPFDVDETSSPSWINFSDTSDARQVHSSLSSYFSLSDLLTKKTPRIKRRGEAERWLLYNLLRSESVFPWCIAGISHKEERIPSGISFLLPRKLWRKQPKKITFY